MSLDILLYTLFIDMINDEIWQQMSVGISHKYKNHHFLCIFFNMDISLIMALIFLKMCMHTTKVCSEGRISQNFDIGLSFCFM